MGAPGADQASSQPDSMGVAMNIDMTVTWQRDDYEDFRVVWKYGRKQVIIEVLTDVLDHMPFGDAEMEWVELTPAGVPVGSSEFLQAKTVGLEEMDKFVREEILSVEPTEWGYVDA